MTPYELLDIAVSISNRIDVQWGLFITVHLALFGGIIYVDRPLRLLEKAGAAVIYFGFAGLNYRVLRLQMDLMQSAYREVAEFSSDACCLDNQLVQHVASDVASGRFAVNDAVLVGAHVVMAMLVLTSIVFDRALGSKGLRQELR